MTWEWIFKKEKSKTCKKQNFNIVSKNYQFKKSIIFYIDKNKIKKYMSNIIENIVMIILS